MLDRAATLLSTFASSDTVVRDERVSAMAALIAGDEPIVASKHTVQSTKGRLDYEARIGRLAIRDAETGEIRGRIFFVAYVVTPKHGGHSRPLTFAWNGGPGIASSIIHMRGLRPRLHGRHGDRLQPT
jgi:carboxypeptidase C (cathepsin A)